MIYWPLANMICSSYDERGSYLGNEGNEENEENEISRLRSR